MPQFHNIYIRLASGETLFAFTWRGDDVEFGIERARSEAPEFGYHDVVAVWAVPA